jgi:ketosteroid isomerase-like protein
VALVGWRIWPAVTTSSGEAIHRDVMAAWNTGDVDAARSLYAPDAIVQLSNFDRPLAEGIDDIVAEVEYQAQVGFVVERTGPVTESEGLVSAPVHISTDADAYGDDAIVVLVVSGEDKIVEHWTIWGGSGS